MDSDFGTAFKGGLSVEYVLAFHVRRGGCTSDAPEALRMPPFLIDLATSKAELTWAAVPKDHLRCSWRNASPYRRAHLKG